MPTERVIHLYAFIRCGKMKGVLGISHSSLWKPPFVGFLKLNFEAGSVRWWIGVGKRLCGEEQ